MLQHNVDDVMSLYDTFVCQMTGKELVDLIRHAAEGVNTVKEEAKRNLAYGDRVYDSILETYYAIPFTAESFRLRKAEGEQ